MRSNPAPADSTEAAVGPTFSVIVAAFNAEDRIEMVMRSVLAQGRGDLELIVVDDGSSDETAERAERVGADDDRVRLIRQANSGTVGARNAGLERARGRFLSFLDDDDFWLQGYLAAVGAALEANPEAGLAYSDAWIMDAATGLVGRRSALERFALPVRRSPANALPSSSLRRLLWVNFITTCSATFTRGSLEAAGRLDASIKGCDDWDLWLRIARSGCGTVRVPARLVVRRVRADSVGSDQLLMARSARAVLDKNLNLGLRDALADRIARQHRWAISREIAASTRGSRPGRIGWGALRRLGRKRVRLPQLERWDPPPREIAEALRPLEVNNLNRVSL